MWWSKYPNDNWFQNKNMHKSFPSCRNKSYTETTKPLSYCMTYLDNHLFHLVYLWDIKLQHVLNPVPQGDCGAGTPCAGTNQLQLDCAIIKTLEDDITSILLHCRPCKWNTPYRGVQKETTKRLRLLSQYSCLTPHCQHHFTKCLS